MRHLRLVACAASLAFLAGALRAGEIDADKALKYRQLEQEVLGCFQEKKYAEAAEKCRAQIELVPNRPDAHYNLACALARLDKKDDALASLTQAVEAGYADSDHMKQDEDLAALRADERFGKLVDKLVEKEKSAPFEKGAEIPGVKTIEDLPEGGLRYRLRMSNDATADKPQRLVVWLHPSGGSMNAVFEGLAPLFVKHGYATLVVTRKNWLYWDQTAADKLLNKTLPAVAKLPGVDAKQPLLMGYSAGGQLALQLWAADASKFSGLILDAAYPLDMEKQQRGQTELMPLPQDEAARKVPFFVLVGADDGGARLWKKAEPEWKQAGVSLAIRYVEGKGHTWLFGQAEVEALEQWLKALEERERNARPGGKP